MDTSIHVSENVTDCGKIRCSTFRWSECVL